MLRVLLTAAALVPGLLGSDQQERHDLRYPFPPPVRWGLSDQHPEVFAFPEQQRLGVDLYREIIDWDVAAPERARRHALAGTPDVHADRFRRWYEGILAGAGETAQREALVSFAGDERGLPPPSTLAYREAVEHFRRAYPAITHFTAFNEPNLGPYADDPQGAGRLFAVLAESCRAPLPATATEGPAPACRVLAGDFADQSDLVRDDGRDYVRDYKRAAGLVAADARGEVTWAVHVYRSAYADAATGAPRTPRGFEAFLARTRGDVWITEAGAFSYLRRGRSPIERPDGDETGARHYAALDLAWMLDRVVDAQPRVKRFYYYQWADHTGGAYDANTPDDSYGTGLVRSAAAPVPTEVLCVYAHRDDRAARQACLR